MTLRTVAVIGVALVSLEACNKTPANDGAGATATPAAAPATAPAAPAASADRVRGTLQAVAPDALTIQTYDGRSVTVPLDAKTGFAWVAASSLSAVKNGDFIGTATSGPDTALRAVEVVIFPESMRGTGEGHYAWDTPGVIASKGGDGASGSSAMTNGTVQSQSAMTNGTVQAQSAMTNGAVTGSTVGSAGEKALTVSYKGGASKVAVPAGTPIVRFEPATKSVLAKGQKVFVVTTPDAKGAKFVAIGKDGITPPM